MIVTIPDASGDYDFLSRYFGGCCAGLMRADCFRLLIFAISADAAPWNGIPEDPVTGSAHTVLGGHWYAKTKKTEFRGLLAPE